jgi:hypothetical protein
MFEGLAAIYIFAGIMAFCFLVGYGAIVARKDPILGWTWLLIVGMPVYITASVLWPFSLSAWYGVQIGKKAKIDTASKT